MTHTHARTLAREHTRKNTVRDCQREKLEARLLYRGCLVAFDGCCGFSGTAAEREKK